MRLTEPIEPTQQDPEFVRLSTVAHRLNAAPSTVMAAIKRGELRAVRLGPRGHWRVEAESLRRLINREDS